LETLIRQGAGRRLTAALDFDNSIVCGDIGEAVMAVLARRGMLNPHHMPPTLSPEFRQADGMLMKPGVAPDVTRYYEAYLAPTVHGQADPTPLANAYTWAVEVMSGLRVSDVVAATAEAFACSRQGELAAIEVTPGQTAYPAPYFRPEMVELIAELLRHEFDVWIVSASNVWSVRYMIIEGLNPLLRRLGLRAGLAPDHVLGASTLLTNRRKELFKDAVLVRESARYAQLDRGTLARLSLTSRLQHPVPVYSGKVAAIWDAIGRPPFLAVGDSPGDHAMLAFSEHRLWIARLDKPEVQAVTARLIRRTGTAAWMVQPTLFQRSPGFVPGLSAVTDRLGRVPANIRAASRHLTPFTTG
jgi:phosphoserine phosphatase